MSHARKGQLAVGGALITGGVAMLIAGLGGFFALNNKVSEAQTQTAVLQANYITLEKKVDEVNLKLDRLLDKLDPTYKTQLKQSTIKE